MRRRFLASGSVAALLVLSLGFDEPKTEIPLDSPSYEHPFVAAVALSPATVQPGQTATLVIKGRTAPGWHIFAADMPTGGSIATSLNLKLPKGITARGEWSYPQAKLNKDGEGWVYDGDLTFKRSVTIGAEVAPGPVDLACEIRYQACDATTCRPPAKLSLKAKAEVTSRR